MFNRDVLHAYDDARSCVHVCVHVCDHACDGCHVYVRAYVHGGGHVCALVYVHVYVRGGGHPYAHAYDCVYVPVDAYVRVCADFRACVHDDARVYDLVCECVCARVLPCGCGDVPVCGRDCAHVCVGGNGPRRASHRHRV